MSLAAPLTATASATRSWVRELRPRQWVKNLLVFAAPGAAGIMLDVDVAARTVAAFALMSVLASGTYLVNDVLDVEADRHHPLKRYRPIAAGVIPVRSAVVVAVLLIVASLSLGLLLEPWFGLVLAIYLATTLSYSSVLKHIPVIDIVTVSAGFVLRALAGAAVVGVGISDWFFVVTTFGSLFMVAGKRLAEMDEQAAGTGVTRAVMEGYTEDFLHYVKTVSSGAAILAYTVWAFERAADASTVIPLFQLSIVPFTAGFLQYALLLERGHGGAPEDLVLSDRTLQAIGCCWLALFALGLLVGS